jgi:hypothetical protein
LFRHWQKYWMLGNEFLMLGLASAATPTSLRQN